MPPKTQDNLLVRSSCERGDPAQQPFAGLEQEQRQQNQEGASVSASAGHLTAMDQGAQSDPGGLG